MDELFEAQLQATLNMIPAYTWYAAPSGPLTFVNKRAADYGGLPEDQIRCWFRPRRVPVNPSRFFGPH